MDVGVYQMYHSLKIKSGAKHSRRRMVGNSVGAGAERSENSIGIPERIVYGIPDPTRVCLAPSLLWTLLLARTPTSRRRSAARVVQLGETARRRRRSARRGRETDGAPSGAHELARAVVA